MKGLATMGAFVVAAGGAGVGSYYATKALIPDKPSALGAVGAGVGGVAGLIGALNAIGPGGMLGRGSFGASAPVKVAAVVAGPVIGALALGNLLD